MFHCFPSEKSCWRVRVREGVIMEVVSLASVKRGQSRMMCVGSRVGEPHRHRSVSGGSAGRNRATYDPVKAWSTAS